MNLKLKWHLKEVARYLLTIPFSLTASLIALIAIRMNQFHSYGLSMYPGLIIPKKIPFDWAIDQLWDRSIAPLLPYFILTLVIDSVLRRVVWKLGER